jgi:hypothetical protein
MCEILFVCPVQFVFTELQSGSNLLLGVHSKPKSCDSENSEKREREFTDGLSKGIFYNNKNGDQNNAYFDTTCWLYFDAFKCPQPELGALGPKGAAPSSAGGGPQPFYALKCCFSLICRISMDLRQSICRHNQLAALSVPQPAAQPQAPNKFGFIELDSAACI